MPLVCIACLCFAPFIFGSAIPFQAASPAIQYYPGAARGSQCFCLRANLGPIAHLIVFAPPIDRLVLQVRFRSFIFRLQPSKTRKLAIEFSPGDP
jgi:hypothetical protein